MSSLGQSEAAGSTHEVPVLNAVAEALNSSNDVRQALEQTLGLVADVLGLRTGWVWLLDRETQQFYSAAVHNLPPYLREPVRMTGKPCWCIQTFLRGKLKPKNIGVLECSRLREAVESRLEDTTEGLRYHATIPLYFRDQPLGIMNVTSPTWRSLSAGELEFLSTVAYQTGIAIERARLADAEKRAARADERTRIAREIHDTLAQDLTAIGLQIEGALSSLESNPERARQRLERALEMSRDGLEEARRSVVDLRAEPLSVALPEAISALGRRLTADTGVRVHVTAPDIPDLDLRTETELYRIAQEALTNISRHAGAAEVEVTLRRRADLLELRVRDDGRGFAPRDTDDRYGILGMRERARLLGGTLTIRSLPERGTSLVVRVPLPEAAA